MSELFYLAILPAIATGVVYLLVVAVAGWIGYRFFGYMPRGYEDRFGSSGRVAVQPPATIGNSPPVAAGRQTDDPTVEAEGTSMHVSGIRTPLTTIIGFSELLSQHATKQLAPAVVVEYASQINSAACQVLGQVDALVAVNSGAGDTETSELQSKDKHLSGALKA